MTRLIDADAIKNLEWITERGMADCGEEFVYMSAIDKMPTVDAEPVRHGHWIRKGLRWHCSACGNGAFKTDFVFGARYCPICGARMDEEMEE